MIYNCMATKHVRCFAQIYKWDQKSNPPEPRQGEVKIWYEPIHNQKCNHMISGANKLLKSNGIQIKPIKIDGKSKCGIIHASPNRNLVR